MDLLQQAEFLSYVVTVIGLPFAILVFIYDKRRERENEDAEIHQRLADDYSSFLKLVLENSDLHLLRKGGSAHDLNEEQKERRFAIFGILIALFESAYILVHEEGMNRQQRRLWLSWEDYMREWVRREDFKRALPRLLLGEDEEFQQYMLKIAEEEKHYKEPVAHGT